VATYNLENLFDPVDDPGREDPVLSAAAYQRKLNKLALTIQQVLSAPTLLTVQEVEHDGVLADLLTRPDLQAPYGAVWLDGPDVRGIDVALLYRTDRAFIRAYEQRQGCRSLQDGLGPDGNHDVQAPANARTCDSNGDGTLGGNRLFSRPPLLVQATICPGPCENDQEGQLIDIWLCVNHWKSKRQGTTWTQYTLPRRLEQAQFVAGLMAEIRKNDAGANLIVLGGLNDHPDSESITIIKDAGFRDLMSSVTRPYRDTFIYQGVSQVLDHNMISPMLHDEFTHIHPHHINVDYPAIYEGIAETVHRSSDHEPVVAHFTVYPYKFDLSLESR
jgi:hypothetical protein